MNARNKSICFLEVILNGKSKNKYNNNCKKMLKEYIGIILKMNNEKIILQKFTEKYHLPSALLNINEIYI